jgi:hypothetical protein
MASSSTTLTTGHFIIVLAILWSLLLPYYPTELLHLLDSFVGIFILLLAALLVLPYGPVPGVVVLVAVALTFVERNRRKIQDKILDTSVAELQQQLKPAPPLRSDEIHPDFETPHEEEAEYMPTEDATDKFTRVDESIDEKGLNATVPTNNAAVARMLQNASLAKTTLE